MPDVEPETLILSVASQLDKNQITSMQAIGELTLAVQALQRQARQSRGNETRADDIDEHQSESKEERAEQKVLTVLSLIKGAVNDTVRTSTPQTPRAQGL